MTGSILLYGGGVLLAVVSQLILKKSADKEQKSGFIKKFLNVRVISAYGLLFLSLFVNTIALRKLEMRFVPCITATSFIWVLLLSRIFLGEIPGKKKIIGTAIIILGIVISVL